MTSPAHDEIFSFHLARLPLLKIPGFLRGIRSVPGLKHSESLITMKLGEPILSPRRYGLTRAAFFAWWEDENALERSLEQPSMRSLAAGWHVRMKLYKRWGEISELRDAFIDPQLASPSQPVVAVTLARLKLSETLRFITWGHPVERQVRDSEGKTLALAAVRPLNTFSTFSIWKNEPEMMKMVHAGNADPDRERHKRAMHEMRRKTFHHEFSTMRFVPIGEFGAWEGNTKYTRP
jgi:hypothetical protein